MLFTDFKKCYFIFAENEYSAMWIGTDVPQTLVKGALMQKGGPLKF